MLRRGSVLLSCIAAAVVSGACGRVGYDPIDERDASVLGGTDGMVESGGTGAVGAGGDTGAGGAVVVGAGGRCSGACEGGLPRVDAAPADAQGAGGGGGATNAGSGGASARDSGSPRDAGPDAPNAGCTLAGARYAVGDVAVLSGTLAFHPVTSAKCVAVSGCGTGRGVNAIQEACSFTPCQLWEPLGLGSGWYALRSAGTGHCLDVDNNYMPSTDVVTWDCWLPTSQNVQAVCAGRDEWRLVSRPSSDVLQIAGGASADGAHVSHAPDLGDPSQRFEIESQDKVFSPIVATGETAPGTTWRYTTAMPAASWNTAGFNDSAWSSGPGGFGSGVGGSLVARTPWTTGDIWLRKSFTLSGMIPASLSLRLSHDEDVEVYLNGVLAFSAGSWETGYFQAAVSAPARAALAVGTNEIAVHCRNTTAPQFIDVGLGEYAWR